MWPSIVLYLLFPCRIFCAELFKILFYTIQLLFTIKNKKTNKMEMHTDKKNCQFRNCAFQGSFAQKNLVWDQGIS